MAVGALDRVEARSLQALQFHLRFRGGLVFKAHRLLYHSPLGSRVMKKKRMILVRVGSMTLYQ